MELKLPFNFGDKYWWINENRDDGSPGPHIAEVRQSSQGIQSVQIDDAGKILIGDGDSDSFDEIGTEYACLSRDQAVGILKSRTDHGNTLLLDPSRETAVILLHADGSRDEMRVKISMDWLQSMISTGFAAGEPDPMGHFAVYDPSAWRHDAPATLFLQDANGNPVQAMYGPFLLLRCRKSEQTGLLELIDTDLSALHKAPEAKGSAPAYDPELRKELKNMTVREFTRALSHYPQDAKLCCCGSGVAYVHCTMGGTAVNIDYDPLDGLEEYEDTEPMTEAGTAGD